MRVCVQGGEQRGKKKKALQGINPTLFVLTAGWDTATVDVCPGSFLMAAGGQVSSRWQRCVKHACSCLGPVSQPPCTTSDHQGLIHNLASNEYFLNILAKVVFD